MPGKPRRRVGAGSGLQRQLAATGTVRVPPRREERFIAPLPEPVVNREKLAELLAEEAEFDTLDYKQKLDLSNHDEQLEFVKDVAAMMMTGGYIVVGADDRGQPTGMFTASNATLFDTATVRNLVDQYITGGDVLCAVHKGERGPIAVVYVAPHRDGLAVLKKNGQRNDGRWVFRAGEVFARHGTRSRRWEQADIIGVRQRIADSIRDDWRLTIEPELLHAASMGGQARSLANAPLGTFGWHLSRESFEAGLAELLRANDRVAVRRAVDQMRRDALKRAWDSDPSVALTELRTVLDRLACFAAMVVHYGFRDWFEEAVAAMVAIYNSGVDQRGSPRQPGASEITPERLWLEVIVRVEAVGGLCVRRADWAGVRTLAMQAPGDSDFYNSWVRHGLTQAARSNLLVEREGDRTVRLHLVQLARTLADEEPCLRPDLPSGDEATLNSILQFDMLVVLMTILGSEPERGRSWYPNFAFWYTTRSEPVVRRFLMDPAMRQLLLPDGTSDADVAAALREVDRRAGTEATLVAGWHGFDDPTIRGFIEKNVRDGAG